MFIIGYFQEEVYIAQPEGFVTKAKKHKVCKLSKASTIYGKHQGHEAYA